MGRNSSSDLYLYLQVPRICCNCPDHPCSPLPLTASQNIAPSFGCRSDSRGQAYRFSQHLPPCAARRQEQPAHLDSPQASFAPICLFVQKNLSDLSLTSHWMP